MSTYVGICTLNPDYERALARGARESGDYVAANQPMAQRVLELRANPPDGVTLLASYPSVQHGRGFIVVEAESHAAIGAISRLYWGVLDIEWEPVMTNPVGA